MKYNEDYLEREFGIFKVGENAYDMPIYWIHTNEVNKNYVEEHKALNLNLHLLNSLNIEDKVVIYLDEYQKVNDDFYISSLDVYDGNDGYIHLLFDGGDPFEYESVEIICNTVANYLNENNICASVEFREIFGEEYIEEFVDFCLSKINE